ERADAYIATRQLLGDDAHRELAHAEAAPLLRHGQSEHAELGHLLDDLDRDQFVLEVPAMGMRRHFAVDEAAELPPHFLERLVIEAKLAEVAGIQTVGDQRGDAPA